MDRSVLAGERAVAALAGSSKNWTIPRIGIKPGVPGRRDQRLWALLRVADLVERRVRRRDREPLRRERPQELDDVLELAREPELLVSTLPLAGVVAGEQLEAHPPRGSGAVVGGHPALRHHAHPHHTADRTEIAVAIIPADAIELLTGRRSGVHSRLRGACLRPDVLKGPSAKEMVLSGLR